MILTSGNILKFRHPRNNTSIKFRDQKADSYRVYESDGLLQMNWVILAQQSEFHPVNNYLSYCKTKESDG